MTTKTRQRNRRYLKNSPPSATLYRSVRPAGESQETARVVRDGGRFGAGLIQSFAVCTRGEALGHGHWIDSTFLEQLDNAMEAGDETGLKSRFTHPDMSGDGLAKFMGRAHVPQLEAGELLRADLHLAKSAHSTPDGNLAGYIMDRTEEDPASFGSSIVFYHDHEAEIAFLEEHGAEWKPDPYWGGEYLDLENFKSPDERNTNNLPHVRLAELEAVDLVDSPAANPGGLFHASPAFDFSAMADYAFGFSDQKPETAAAYGIDPDRARAFVTRYLTNRRLSLSIGAPPVDPADNPETPADPDPTPDADSPDTPPADPSPETPADPPAADTPTPPAADAPEEPTEQSDPGQDPPADDPIASTLAEYRQALGDDAAAFRAVSEGKTIQQAQGEMIEALRQENLQLREQLALQEKEEPGAIPTKPSRQGRKPLSRIAGRHPK